jgi:hypothetical protein
MAQTIAEQAGDVAALAKSQMDDRKAARGTVKALGRDEEELPCGSPFLIFGQR